MLKRDFSGLPKDVKPISPVEYLALTMLFAVPLLGIVALIVFAFWAKNINRRNFARAFFVPVIIVLVFMVLSLLGAATDGAIEFFKDIFYDISQNGSDAII